MSSEKFVHINDVVSNYVLISTYVIPLSNGTSDSGYVVIDSEFDDSKRAARKAGFTRGTYRSIYYNLSKTRCVREFLGLSHLEIADLPQIIQNLLRVNELPEAEWDALKASLEMEGKSLERIPFESPKRNKVKTKVDPK